jgi:hypothetical protein
MCQTGGGGCAGTQLDVCHLEVTRTGVTRFGDARYGPVYKGCLWNRCRKVVRPCLFIKPNTDVITLHYGVISEYLAWLYEIHAGKREILTQDRKLLVIAQDSRTKTKG